MAYTVSHVAPGELATACRVLFISDCEDDAVFSRGIDPNGLFVAKDACGEIRGAVLVQVLPGAVGVIAPPRMMEGRERIAVEEALVSRACEWLRSQDVKVCQTFASVAERDVLSPLERSGFRRVTQLAHMRRAVETDRRRPSELLEGTYFVPGIRDEFQRVLMATYDGTLDCPELNGVRTAEEVFCGFTPDRGQIAGPWFLVNDRGKPAGVVMLDRAGEPDEWVLAYLGLIPEARGRGLGDKLLRFALDEASIAGIGALSLSVDARNNPAIRLYRRNGFIEYDRQDVYLAIWRREQPV